MALQSFLQVRRLSAHAPVNQGAPGHHWRRRCLQQAVPEWSMELFIEATHLAGCRAIIQTSSANYPECSQQENIYSIGRHPHQSLFTNCAAIVHHGGAGTTHSASLCGRPSIVIPFMDEQLFWAKSLEQLGLAASPLAAKNATAPLIASRIKTILSSNSYLENAKKAGSIIINRQGVSNAVDLIEKTFRDKSY